MPISAPEKLGGPLDRLVTLPDELPSLTLGWEAVKWAAKYLRQPNGRNAGQRFEFTRSQVIFLLHWYALDESGEWIYRRGVRRLAKGSGKSPFAALLALVELCAPVRLDDWDPDAPGGAVGKPVSMPWVVIAATTEAQTENTMRMVRAFAPKGSRVVNGNEIIKAPAPVDVVIFTVTVKNTFLLTRLYRNKDDEVTEPVVAEIDGDTGDHS